MFLFRDFTISTEKEIRAALRQIYGIGWNTTIKISSQAGLGYPFYLNKINLYRFELIVYLLRASIISDVRIKRSIEFNISNYVNMGCMRGFRHALCLPIHGQRTRTNAKTQRTKRQRQKQIYMRN